MESVQHQADIRVGRPAHHLPAVAVVVNMAAPGHRLIGHTQVSPRGPGDLRNRETAAA